MKVLARSSWPCGPFCHSVRSRSATGLPRAAERSRYIPADWAAEAWTGCQGAWGGRFRCPSRSNRSFFLLRCIRSRNSTGSLATAPLSASHPLGTRWAGPGRHPLALKRPDPYRQTPTRPSSTQRLLDSRFGWCSSCFLRSSRPPVPPTAQCALASGSKIGNFLLRACKWTPPALLPIPTSRARATQAATSVYPVQSCSITAAGAQKTFDDPVSTALGG